jgi:hypothetical protein
MKFVLRVFFLAALALAPFGAAGDTSSPSDSKPLVACKTGLGATDLLAMFDQEEKDPLWHGGGLNACGCHFNRKTGDCHCHQARGCGCKCQPASCK